MVARGDMKMESMEKKDGGVKRGFFNYDCTSNGIRIVVSTPCLWRVVEGERVVERGRVVEGERWLENKMLWLMKALLCDLWMCIGCW